MMYNPQEHAQALDYIDEKMKTMKDEIDGLQVAVTRFNKPWHKDATALVAVLALLFSFSTTIFSYFENQSRELLAHRADLRSLIQRLGALPKENAELELRFGDKPNVWGPLSGQINQENTLIALQAADVLRRIEEKISVSSTEYYAVGSALMLAGLQDVGIRFMTKSIEKSDDLNSAIAAARGLGNYHYLAGNAKEGRRFFEHAVNLANGGNSFFIAISNALTKMYWSQSEVILQNCAEAKKHLEEAYDEATQLIIDVGPEEVLRENNPMYSQVYGQLNAAKQFVDGCKARRP